MGVFKEIITKTLKNEGGYVFHPSDPGGETFMGIARRYHDNWEGWSIVDSHDFKGNIHKDPVLIKMVELFYYKTFWSEYKMDDIRHPAIAFLAFDAHVLMGRAAGKLVQAAANKAKASTHLKVDGEIGPQTLAVLNDLNKLEVIAFIEAFCSMSLGYLLHSGHSHIFYSGWEKRWLGNYTWTLEQYINA